VLAALEAKRGLRLALPQLLMGCSAHDAKIVSFVLNLVDCQDAVQSFLRPLLVGWTCHTFMI
jgi:hypothetical protein